MSEGLDGGLDSPSPSERRELIARALRLEWITLGWMLIEAAVAIGSGIIAHSLTLIAFGADSILELASAGVLIRRLAIEVRRGEAVAAELPHGSDRSCCSPSLATSSPRPAGACGRGAARNSRSSAWSWPSSRSR